MLARRGFLAGYAALAKVSFRDAARSWPSHIGIAIFLCFLLFIFSSLWKTIAADKTWIVSPLVMVWYVAIAEIPLMALARIPRFVEEDIRKGSFSLYLCRPKGYFRRFLVEQLAIAAFRLATLLVVGTTFCLLLTREFPISPFFLLLAVLLASLAAFLSCLQQIALGACALWIDEATPLFWVWQKLAFVFGGLLVPLHFYPETLQSIAFYTPFSAMIYGPASLLFDPSLERFIQVLTSLLLWCLISVLFLIVLTKKGIAYAIENGKGS